MRGQPKTDTLFGGELAAAHESVRTVFEVHAVAKMNVGDAPLYVFKRKYLRTLSRRNSHTVGSRHGEGVLLDRTRNDLEVAIAAVHTSARVVQTKASHAGHAARRAGR